MKTTHNAAGAICALALFAVSAAHAATSPEDALKYRADIEEGISILKSGESNERAIAKFKNALKIESESAEAYYWIALCYSDRGNYTRAADNCKEATTYDTRMAEAWSLWGQALLYQKEWNDARDKLETALRLTPDDPYALFNLGRVHYHGMKDPTTALANFRNAWQRSQALARNNPGNDSEYARLATRARYYMGLCEYDRGRANDNSLFYSNAINAFYDVIKEQPTNYEAAMRLSMAYRKANRVNDCLQMLKEIHSHMTKNDPAYFDRHLFAEVNLLLADIYLKDPVLNNPVFAVHHLRQFVEYTGDSNHPALEPAKEFLAKYPS